MPIPFPTGGDIVSLLARQSDPAAQAKLASGEIWGRTLSQLGQLPSQIMEQRARDQQLQLQRQTQALQAFKLQQEVQQQQQAIAGQQRANQAITDFYKEQNGAQIFDPSKLDAKLAEANVPLDQREKAMASLDAMNKAMLGFSDHRQAAQNTILKHVQEEGATPENLSVAFDLGTRNGAFTPQDIEDYKARTQQGMTPQQWVDLRIGQKPAKDIEEEAKAKIAAGQAAGMSPEGLLPEQQATLEISRQAAERQAAAQAFSQQARTKELAQGDTRIALERQRLAQGPATGPNASQDQSDVKETVQGMKDGTIPPQLPSRASREYTALTAEAHRQGFDLAKANQDWTATQRYLGTLNGQQQTRLRQAVSFTRESVPTIRALVNQWDAGRFPVLNSANLKLAMNGAYGQQAASVATRLNAQIADLTSELGTVYKGGNSSTDESLKLAAENLKSDWSKKVALDALDQIDRNLTIRENSMRNVGVAGISDNQYAPKPAGTKRFNPATGKIE